MIVGKVIPATILGETHQEFWRDVLKSVLSGVVIAITLAILWRHTPLRKVKA